MDTRRDFIYVDDLVDVRACKAIDGDGAAAPTTSPRARTTRSRSCSTRRSTALGARARRAEVEVRAAQPGRRASRSCSTQSQTERDFGWRPDDAARARASPRRSTTTASTGSTRRSRTCKRRAGRAADASEPLGGTPTSSSSAAPASSARNLVRDAARARRRATSLVVDNLLSAERENVPDDARVELRRGLDRRRRGPRAGSPTSSTTSSTSRPTTATRARSPTRSPTTSNNLITTLKLFERLKDFAAARASVVYAASGCTLRRADLRRAPRRRRRTRRCSLDLDSPYQISKVVGEFYAVYYHRAARPADRAGALPERLRPRRDPRRRPLARDAGDRLAQRHADVRLPRAQGRCRCRLDERRHRDAATSSTSRTSSRA